MKLNKKTQNRLARERASLYIISKAVSVLHRFFFLPLLLLFKCISKTNSIFLPSEQHFILEETITDLLDLEDLVLDLIGCFKEDCNKRIREGIHIKSEMGMIEL